MRFTSGYGAPLRAAAFVLPAESQGALERFAVPRPVEQGQCEPFDLSTLEPQGTDRAGR